MEVFNQITVIPYNKNKNKIYINDEYYTKLNIGLCNGIEDKKLCEIDELMLDSEQIEAQDKLFDYLSKAYKTKMEAVIYLKNREYNNKIIYLVIEKALEYHFLDDERYANYYIEFNKNKKGLRRIKQELKLKGISDDIINNLLIEEEQELNSAMLLARKFAKSKKDDEKFREKLIRHLMGKGYNWDTINEVLIKINE